ncbi:MAG: hypothetical protein U9O53_05715 [archaeon]|nr:hypothetical protein [archaeon]
MSQATTMNDIKNDLDFLKDKILQIEATVNEIDTDIHKKLNSQYIKKLEKIEKEDKRIHFKNIEDFDKRFDL